MLAEHRCTKPLVAPAPLDKASVLFGSTAEVVIKGELSPASGVGLLSALEPPTRGLGWREATPRFRLFALNYWRSCVTWGYGLLVKGQCAPPSRQWWLELDGTVPLGNGGSRRSVQCTSGQAWGGGSTQRKGGPSEPQKLMVGWYSTTGEWWSNKECPAYKWASMGRRQEALPDRIEVR